MRSERLARFSTFITIVILANLLIGTSPAQTTIVSTVPANGASGISTTTTVVFTFSAPMDPSATSASFYNDMFTAVYPVTESWSAGDTVLTCTPLTPFPQNTHINWFVTGDDANGDPLDGFGFANGAFSTGTGGPSGNGTNAITTFSVGKVHHYNQTSAGAATLDPLTPYGFSGVTTLASNRTANTVSLNTPTTATLNLTHLPPPVAEIFLLSTNFTSLSTFDAAFPAGNYSFFVQAASSNQTVVVNLPSAASQPQPGPPHVTTFVAAQNVNPNQTFVLGWDAFPGGTAADYIDVDIGSDFGSPNPGLPGALSGTGVTFTIPASTLQPNTTYPSRIGFYRHVGVTNANYVTDAYRATYTEFNLVTGPSGMTSLVLTNPIYAPGSFSFEVLCTNGQTVTVEYRTNLAIGSWQTLLTTNSPGNRFRAVSPQAATNRFLFFRARSGS